MINTNIMLQNYDIFVSDVLRFTCWRWGDGWMKDVLGGKCQKLTSRGDLCSKLDSKIQKSFSCEVLSNKNTYFKP